MKMNINILATSIVLMISIYLFITAPPPLASDTSAGTNIPVQYALRVLNEENKVARSLYTKEIVLAGKKSGLKFNEDWDDKNIHAGPLPAQFLRLLAMHLEKSKIPLGLYLGSDFPINKANLLEGKQANKFINIKKTLTPQYFYVEDIDRYIYMAADVAVSKACVNCHNKHKDTPKTDWELDDVMGATTWTYPKQYVSYTEFILMIQEIRRGINRAYASYLEKVKTFPSAPKIGNQWPRSGYFLPDAKSFAEEIVNQASGNSLTMLMTAANDDKNGQIKMGAR
ncbi:MAG: DUF3365 domain-containing protein [Thiohalomonadales bacterium]